jgi:hypothetical protein
MYSPCDWGCCSYAPLLEVGRILGGVRRYVFFGDGNTWAPQVRLPERDFNVLSGWGAGSRVPRLWEPFVYYLVARRVVLRFCL